MWVCVVRWCLSVFHGKVGVCELVDFKYLSHSVYVAMIFHVLCMDYQILPAPVPFSSLTLPHVAMPLYATPGEGFPRLSFAFYGVLLCADQGQRPRPR